MNERMSAAKSCWVTIVLHFSSDFIKNISRSVKNYRSEFRAIKMVTRHGREMGTTQSHKLKLQAIKKEENF